MSVRAAVPADLPLLQGIEDAADRLLVERLQPGSWSPAPPGEERAAEPGFLLVAEEEATADVVGFAHVIEQDGLAHLEQLAVLPQHGRLGHGRALVGAAKREAGRRGYGRITLRTYAGVPFNAPFYASCGFVESEPDAPFLEELVRVEARLGLDHWGRRVQMTASSTGSGPTSGP